MGKTYQYLIILSTMLVVFYMFGLVQGVLLLDILLNPAAITQYSWWQLLMNVITLLIAIVGISVGFIPGLGQNLIYAARAGVASALVQYLLGIISIWTVVASWNPTFAALTVSPFIILLILLIIDWISGMSA